MSGRDKLEDEFIEAITTSEIDKLDSMLQKYPERLSVNKPLSFWTLGERKYSKPLNLACEFWELEATRFLLSKGADIEGLDEGGSTPLLLAAKADHCEIVGFLLKEGASVNVKSAYYNWRSPLHFAVEQDNLELVKLLVEHGADLEARDAVEYTPLFMVKSIEVAGFLIEAGADANAKSKGGFSLDLHLAIYQDEALVQFVAAHREKISLEKTVVTTKESTKKNKI